MALYRLKNKTALLLKPKADEFLNAYTSNTLYRSLNAFLDRNGKIVAVCHVKRFSANESLVVIEKAFLDRLLKHLEKYLAFSDTKIAVLKHRIYYETGKNYKPSGQDSVIDDGKGQMIVSENEVPAAECDEAYAWFRLENQLPLQGVDFDEEMLLCVGDEPYVSYEKGCYLGQEIIARVHYKGKAPKKLVVRSEDECTPEERQRMTSKAAHPETKKIFGFVFTENKG